jgi:photosystem I subunit 11
VNLYRGRRKEQTERETQREMASAAMVKAGGLLSLQQCATTNKAAVRGSSAFFGSAAPLRFRQSASMVAARPLGVRAATTADGKYQVIEPVNGDPFVGGLETPINSSPLIAWYLSNLPAYRTAVSPLLRGVEVGLAHGFLLVGPFVKTGPLRNTDIAGTAGSFGAAGLVVILSVALTIYGIATFKEGAPSLAPTLTLSGRKKEADKLQTSQGWASFSGGFFFGGLSGVGWAYFLLYVLSLPYPVK